MICEKRFHEFDTIVDCDVHERFVSEMFGKGSLMFRALFHQKLHDFRAYKVLDRVSLLVALVHWFKTHYEIG